MRIDSEEAALFAIIDAKRPLRRKPVRAASASNANPVTSVIEG